MDQRGDGRSIEGLSRFLTPRSASPATAPDLRRFLEPRKRATPGERCEFCTEPLADHHSHVVNLETRSLMCACRSCYFLFAPDGAAGGRYKAVPEDITLDPDFALSEGQWDALQIPVAMAFFFHQSDIGHAVAFYPSPAGATESLLPLDTWDELVAANPILGRMASDVEALLVYRPRGEAQRCYLVPIDACYQLVGLIRRHWKGFDGGEEAWHEIDAFFSDLTARSRPPRPAIRG
jgi:hypothetical protein